MLAKSVLFALISPHIPFHLLTHLLVTRDIKSYQDVITSFGIPSLHERFEFIRQLGQVFLVRPEILKSYITEGYLGRIDSSLLRPYLAQRSDWGQAEKGFNDGAEDMLSPGGGGAAGGEGKGGLRDRFGMGRLSTIMKDLELRDHVPSLPTGMSMPSLNMTSKAFSSHSNGS